MNAPAAVDSNPELTKQFAAIDKAELGPALKAVLKDMVSLGGYEISFEALSLTISHPNTELDDNHVRTVHCYRGAGDEDDEENRAYPDGWLVDVNYYPQDSFHKHCDDEAHACVAEICRSELALRAKEQAEEAAARSATASAPEQPRRRARP